MRNEFLELDSKSLKQLYKVINCRPTHVLERNRAMSVDGKLVIPSNIMFMKKFPERADTPKVIP